MYIGVDLGSTNIKAALYDREMKLIDRCSRPVAYIREDGHVEFNAEVYFDELVELLAQMCKEHGVSAVNEIAFTGQAESLVCVGEDGHAVMNAISWMDERSVEECAILQEKFTAAKIERVTGQLAVLPTWPATKIMWLKKHAPEVIEATTTYMLLKDYIIFRLTGVKAADMSIATFSFYFDIYEKCYWQEMLDVVGVTKEQLPKLVEPCSVIGTVLEAVAAQIGIGRETKINCGTLDHFAGMIGTGNISRGSMTLSTGTVMALTAMSSEPAPRDSGIAMHYGFIPDTHVMLPVAESGGVSLEWFHRNCMDGISYDQMNEVLEKRGGEHTLLFLPYLVGTNAPEFDADATGVFWGLRQEHDAYDMAYAVMEGVAFVLRKNCEKIREKGTVIKHIIATGGGAKSPIWCQLQADITGCPVVLPKEKEAACLGAAMIAAVSDGKYTDYQAACDDCVSMEMQYGTHASEQTEAKYRKFCALYDAALQIARM